MKNYLYIILFAAFSPASSADSCLSGNDITFKASLPDGATNMVWMSHSLVESVSFHIDWDMLKKWADICSVHLKKSQKHASEHIYRWDVELDSGAEAMVVWNSKTGSACIEFTKTMDEDLLEQEKVTAYECQTD